MLGRQFGRWSMQPPKWTVIDPSSPRAAVMLLTL
jgi:hypothetical protein